jgi:hypothetical protein
MKEAETYATKLRSRGWTVDIVTFRVSEDDFAAMNKADVTQMSSDDADAFMDRYSRLYGAGESHNYDYIRGYTGMGHENYFNKSVFSLLEFVG